jgi:hypothetical protein
MNRGDVVIVSRGEQVILGNVPDVLYVQLASPVTDPYPADTGTREPGEH